MAVYTNINKNKIEITVRGPLIWSESTGDPGPPDPPNPGQKSVKT